MELTDTQTQAVAKWAEEGLGLSEIQKNLQEEFGINMTYMDVRFLVLDIGCAIKDKEKAPKPKPEAVPQAAPEALDEPAAGLPGAAEEPGLGSGVSVELDRVVKAGSVVSGTVVFSDGVKAAWAVDNMGRMVLDPGADNEGYRPSEDDVRAFQEELKNEITRRGM
jgi:hypothetical protein